MERTDNDSQLSEQPELTPPHKGVGPLLQRDYWAVIDRCALNPQQLVELVARRFESFSPEELVTFERLDTAHDSLQEGDQLDLHIKAAGDFSVQVIHRDEQSLTLCTVAGHPEAGRITFGAYRNDRGDVIFHIRSRARSGSHKHLIGFFALGEAMQTNTWTDFVNRVAVTVGKGVIGAVFSETKRIEDEPESIAARTPTFRALGG